MFRGRLDVHVTHIALRLAVAPGRAMRLRPVGERKLYRLYTLYTLYSDVQILRRARWDMGSGQWSRRGRS